MTIYHEYWRRCRAVTDIQSHLSLLYTEARGNVLELGVRGGNSTAALLAGVETRGGHLYSVDKDDCSKALEPHEQWTFIQADSLDEKVLQTIPGSLDLLFIDADHTYERTRDELNLYGGFVTGKILLHDTDLHQSVRKAMFEYCERNGFMFWLLPGSHGLGIIECKQS